MVKKIKYNGPDPPGQFQQQQQQQAQQQQHESTPFPELFSSDFTHILRQLESETDARQPPSQQTPQMMPLSAVQNAIHISQQTTNMASQASQVQTRPGNAFPQNYSTLSVGTGVQTVVQRPTWSNQHPPQGVAPQTNSNGGTAQWNPQHLSVGQNSAQQMSLGVGNTQNQTVARNCMVTPRPGGSIALFIPENYGGNRKTGHDDLMAVSGTSNWSKYSATSPIFDKTDGNCTDAMDEPIQGQSYESPVGPPVSQFPLRQTFAGAFDLKVEFPGDSPKLIVSDTQNGRRRINTVMGNQITAKIHHKADHRSTVRFLLVYSRDSETTQPVLPCRNHQQEAHPSHMLEVTTGVGNPIWHDVPHPSIVVCPSPVSNGEYSVQLKFLCRNSCLTRKDLTLICQLERLDKVLGRECLEVKVSACPRRDASRTQQQTHPNQPPNKAPRMERGPQECVGGYQEVPPEFSAMSLPLESPQSAFVQARTAGRQAAFCAFLEQRLKELDPQRHENLLMEFNALWESQMHY